MHTNRWISRFKACFCILLVWCYPTVSQAATVLLASSNLDRYSLDTVSRYWQAPHPLSFSTLRALEPPFEQVSVPADLNFGYTTSDVWLSSQIRNPSSLPATWVVKFEYPLLDHITLYTVRTHSQDILHSGSAVPVAERALPYRQAAFPLHLAGGETVTLYAKVHASGSKILNYSLMSLDAFYTQNDRHNFWLATYFGMLLALSTYNLLLFFGLKEQVFLHYALFALGFTVAILTFNGIGTLMFWSFLGDNAIRLVALGFIFASAMATLFAQSFLNTALHSQRWHYALSVFRIYCWIALATALFLPLQTALRLMDITGLLTSLLLFLCGLHGSLHRVPNARLFILAWSIFLVGASVFAMRNLGLLPANFVTLHGIQIGSAIEMLLLSFALAARFNQLKWQKERAQTEAVAMLKRQEAVLEAKVATRTQALERLANHDMLTGLLNRNGLARFANNALERCAKHHATLSLFMCDLDRFKPINDEYGHEAGDFVLQQIARRLEHLGRESDRCARFGGDEFIVLLEGVNDESVLRELRSRIDQAIRAPIKLPCGAIVSVGASIGVSSHKGDNTSLESLIREADQDMYAVKARQPYYRYGSAVSLGEY